MRNTLTVTAALMLTTSQAFAVGLDRSNQDIGIIFEEGDYAELSFGSISPDITGQDGTEFAGGAPGTFQGRETGNVADDFTQFSFGFKAQLTDQLSASVIFDEPYGADIAYPATTATDGSIALGGTAAELNSSAVTGLLRYEFDNNFSVHGGIRVQTLDANITLGGAAFGGPPPTGISGFNVDLGESTEVGFTGGVAYERPDIALRVALTYHSEIEHEFPTVDNFAGASTTTVTTPQAVNLDFQSGIAENTLLFGSIRWAEYSVVIVDPLGFPGDSLTDIEDGFSYTLGVGRQFTEDFAASISVGLETEGDDDLVSPLSPTNGSVRLTVGGAYDLNDNVTISGGVSYVTFGDAFAATSEVARAEFTDNDAIGVGVSIGYQF